MSVTHQIIIAFQFGFLIIRALEEGIQRGNFGTPIITHYDKESIHSIHGHAQDFTSNFSCQNIDWKRMIVTFQIIVAFQFGFRIIRALEKGIQRGKFGTPIIAHYDKESIHSIHGHAQDFTSNVSCHNIDWKRMIVTFQIIVAFQFGFLIIRALEEGIQRGKFGTPIITHYDKESIHSIHGHAQDFTSNVSCHNIDWKRMIVTF